LDSCAAVRYVVHMASENAALLVKKQERVLRDCRPSDGSSFDHETSIESDADPLLFPPDDVAGRMMSVSLQNQSETIGDTYRSGYVQGGSRMGQVANHAIDRAAAELDRSSLQDAMTICTTLFHIRILRCRRLNARSIFIL
jgi:hypothetical protein